MSSIDDKGTALIWESAASVDPKHWDLVAQLRQAESAYQKAEQELSDALCPPIRIRSLDLLSLEEARDKRRVALQKALLAVERHESGLVASTVPEKHVLKSVKQQERILEILTSKRIDPRNLPEREKGRAGAKAVVRAIALHEPGLFTPKSFDKAWAALRSDGRLAGDD